MPIKFTGNQKLILECLKATPDATNADLVVALNVTNWKVASELLGLRVALKPATRYAIVGLAEAHGWRATGEEASDETIKQHINRLIASDFPDGPLKPLAVQGEALHHEVANLATQVWGECENQTPVSDRMLNRFKARTARVRAILNQLDVLIDEAKKNS